MTRGWVGRWEVKILPIKKMEKNRACTMREEVSISLIVSVVLFSIVAVCNL